MNAARTLTIAAAAAVTFGAAATASADQVEYIGAHPARAGGFCYIEAPHVHVYAPSRKKHGRKLLYRVHDGRYHFVGDPVAHGYDGPKVAYYGHHPIEVEVEGVEVESDPEIVDICYINGPHFHAYAPAPSLKFEVKGDAYWFTGEYPASYKRHRKTYVGINAVYRPVEYHRPVIEVEPPVAYVGPVIEVHDHGHRPAVRAGIGVEVSAPSVEIGIGLPGVIVHDHHDVVEVRHRHHKHRKVKFRRKHRKHRGWRR